MSLIASQACVRARKAELRVRGAACAAVCALACCVLSGMFPVVSVGRRACDMVDAACAKAL
eukprot:7121470-Lingulodinium_polyedra.AAC.1